MGLAARALDMEPAPWGERRWTRFAPDPAMNVRHIVFFLNDSLPESIIVRMESDPASVCLREVQAALDELHGDACLGQPWIANSIEKALKRADGRDYRLIAWRILPNHVHVLLEPGAAWPWGDPVDRWKLLSSPGPKRPGAPNLKRFGPDGLRPRVRAQYERPDEFWAGEDFERILDTPGEVEMALHGMELRAARYSRRLYRPQLPPERPADVEPIPRRPRPQASPPEASPPEPSPPRSPPLKPAPEFARPKAAPAQGLDRDRPSATSPPWGSALTFPPASPARTTPPRAKVQARSRKTKEHSSGLTSLLAAILIFGLMAYAFTRL